MYNYWCLNLICSLCVLPEIKLKIASNKVIIEQMLSVTLCPFLGDHFAERVVVILLVLSHSPETHSHIILHSTFTEFVLKETVTQKYSDEVQELLR